MQLVIADTGPVNYLIPIGHIDLLPRLFERVFLPTAVKEELNDIGAPAAVRAWIGSPPAWLEIMETPSPGSATLDEGEAAVMALAISLRADVVLIDERRGVQAAPNQGLRVTGTLGLLEIGAQSGLVDFTEAAARLRLTTFRSPEALDGIARLPTSKRFFQTADQQPAL